MNYCSKELAKLKSWILLLLSLFGMTGLVVTPLLFVSFTTSVLAQTQSDKKAEADRLLQQGNQDFYVSQYREALQSWQKALEIYRDIGELYGEGAVLDSLGRAYNSLRDYPKAIEYYQQALVIARKIGTSQGEAASLNNLGNAYDSLGEYPKAIDFHQQSLAIFQAIGDRQGKAQSLGNLGNAYDSLGEYPKAIDFYQQSLAIFQAIGDREGEGITLSNLGDLYKEQEQPELAIVFYKQSVIIRDGIRQGIQVLERQLQESYTETVAGTYRSLADLLLSQDRIYEAQQVLELLKLQEIQDFTRSQRARSLSGLKILPSNRCS